MKRLRSLSNLLGKNRRAFFTFLFGLCVGVGIISFAVTNFFFSPETSEASALRIVQACKNRPKETCYALQLRDVANAKGAEPAFEILFAMQQLDPFALGCHFMAHGIGLGAYARDPEHWQTLIRTMNRACSYGGIHGVLERYIGTFPDGKLTPEVIPEICGEEPIADCNHIVGHLILVMTDGDVSQALNFCKIFRSPDQLSFCATGVFMEFSTALNLIEHKLAPESWKNWPLRVPEIVKLCNSQAEEIFTIVCWEESVHAALEKYHYNAEAIFAFCDDAPIAEARRHCRRHAIGIMAAHYRFNLPAIDSMCKIPSADDPDFEDTCYGYLTSSWSATIPTAGPAIEAFCHTLEAQYQPTCLRYAGHPTIPRGN